MFTQKIKGDQSDLLKGLVSMETKDTWESYS